MKKETKDTLIYMPLTLIMVVCWTIYLLEQIG